MAAISIIVLLAMVASSADAFVCANGTDVHACCMNATGTCTELACDTCIAAEGTPNEAPTCDNTTNVCNFTGSACCVVCNDNVTFCLDGTYYDSCETDANATAESINATNCTATFSFESTCANETATCPTSCGNGVTETGEDCDGGTTCSDTCATIAEDSSTTTTTTTGTTTTTTTPTSGLSAAGVALLVGGGVAVAIIVGCIAFGTYEPSTPQYAVTTTVIKEVDPDNVEARGNARMRRQQRRQHAMQLRSHE